MGPSAQSGQVGSAVLRMETCFRILSRTSRAAPQDMSRFCAIVVATFLSASSAFQPLRRAPTRRRPTMAPRRSQVQMINFPNPFEGMKNPLENFGDDGDGISVCSVKVSFSCRDRGYQSILAAVDRIAESADTSSSAGLANLVADTTLSMLRRTDDWVACAGECDYYRSGKVGG